MRVHIDYETRSYADLTKVGAYNYWVDPSTEILCLSYAVDDGPVKLVTFDELTSALQGDGMCPVLTNLKALAKNPNVIFAAHNASFEIYGWKYYLEPKLGFPPAPENRWICTLAKCAAHSLPLSLGQAADALHLKHRKDITGYRVMMQVCRPNKWGEFSFTPEQANALYHYNKKDVVVERLIDDKLKDLSPREQKIWELDRRINERGFEADAWLAQAALNVVAQYKAELVDDFQFAVGYSIKKPTQRKQLLQWLSTKDVDLSNTQAKTFEGILEDGMVPEEIATVLQISIETNKASVAKYKKIVALVDDVNRIHDSLQYHAANTGRWGGRGLQPQNMPRGTVDSGKAVAAFYETKESIAFKKFKDVIDKLRVTFPLAKAPVFEAIVSMVRGTIKAPVGRVLIGGDYSAIEARVLSWLTGNDFMLDLFRTGKDPYKAMAAVIFDVAVEDVTDAQRFDGKTTVLGCGYQMGYKRFAEQNNVDEKLAERCVGAYREQNDCVVDYWYKVNQAAKDAVRLGGVHTAGPVSFSLVYGGRFLACKLPSGRCIMYPAPRLEEKEAPWSTEEEPKYIEVLTYAAEVNNHWLRDSTYGGKLTENICQAIARDCMAHAMLKLDAAGFELILTIHDEIMAEHDKENAEARAEEFRRICEEPPPWAPDLPLKMEVWVRERYKK